MVWFLLELHYLEQVFMINFIFWNTKIDFSLICNKEFSNMSRENPHLFNKLGLKDYRSRRAANLIVSANLTKNL